MFWVSTLEQRKLLLWLKSKIKSIEATIKYQEDNGMTADTPTSGEFADVPTVVDNSIPVGFHYFCTDKQTVEGETDGIEIIHKGNDVWVDALGRTIE